MDPENWRRCQCGLPVLDGHLTCGSVFCNEAEAREAQRVLIVAADCEGRPRRILRDLPSDLEVK